MAAQPCVDAITKVYQDAYQRNPTEDEIDSIATSAQMRMKAKMDQGMSKAQAIRAATKEASEEAQFAANKAKWNRYNNLLIAADPTRHTLSGLMSMVSPEMRSSAENAGLTIGVIHDSLMKDLVYPMGRAIDKLGLRRISTSRDPAQQLRIVKEMYHLGDPEKFPSTGDENAEALAKIYADVFEKSRLMQNQRGAFIGKSETPYVGRQIWDMMKTRAASFEDWKKDFGQTTGPLARTKDFAGLAPPQIESLLQSQYEAIRSGTFDNRAATQSGGAFDIAKKISQQRTINFDTPEGYMNARTKYSDTGSIGEGVYAQAHAGAKNAAVMELFGSQPKAMAQRLQAAAAERARTSGDLALMDKIKNDRTFKNTFELATGLYDHPGSETLASYGANLRSLTQLKDLGQLFAGGRALIHSGLAAIQVSRTDTSALVQTARMIRAIFPGSINQDLAAAVHAGHDGMYQGFVRQFHEGGTGNGSLSNAVNMFYRLNGFGSYMDRIKYGVATGLTHSMGINAGKTLEQLSPMWQNDLLRYGIKSADWDTMRAAAAPAADGRMHVIPSSIEDPKVRLKAQNYVSGEVATAANEPTPWARNIANVGTQSGTWAGEIARVLTQFKSFPITIMQRQWGQQMRGGAMNNIPGILQLASASMAYGFLGLELSGVLKNQKQALPTDTAGWLELAARSATYGGMTGIIGDAFLNEGVKSGADWAKAALGPTVGTIADIAAAFNAPAEFESKSPGQRALSAAHNIAGQLTPNFFATSMAYNYFYPYLIANFIHPGAIARHERVMQAHQQSWILPPH